jgi:hypothetical protein
VAFLLVIPVVFVLAEAWVMWSGRTRKAPEAYATVAQYQRARAALAPTRVIDVRDERGAGVRRGPAPPAPSRRAS